MSDIPVEQLGYASVVAEFFLGLRGSGLMLSPLDTELVAEWERRGIPIAVVCRGLRRGLEERMLERPPGAPPPRTLRACRHAVEEEWRAYRHGRVGESPSPGGEGEAAEARIEEARRRLAEAEGTSAGGRREAYRAAHRALLRARPTAPGLAAAETALAAADDALLAAWLASLAPPERRGLGPRLRLLAGPRPSATRPAAYRDMLRLHLLEAARRAGLVPLRGSV
jgi:hypothetical protein